MFFQQRTNNTVSRCLSLSLKRWLCNCAVVSTKFGGLPDMFSESEGFKFVEGELSSGLTSPRRTLERVIWW